jgi:MoxR-like ATPase
MTPDLLPGEILGTLRPKADGSGYEFRQGLIFTQILLADELNRTGPKTQAALLEAMAEGTVTVDGVTHRLPDPFWVIATQNPSESAGVFSLPESELDRFMMLVEMIMNTMTI